MTDKPTYVTRSPRENEAIMELTRGWRIELSSDFEGFIPDAHTRVMESHGYLDKGDEQQPESKYDNPGS